MSRDAAEPGCVKGCDHICRGVVEESSRFNVAKAEAADLLKCAGVVGFELVANRVELQPKGKAEWVGMGLPRGQQSRGSGKRGGRLDEAATTDMDHGPLCAEGLEGCGSSSRPRC